MNMKRIRTNAKLDSFQISRRRTAPSNAATRLAKAVCLAALASAWVARSATIPDLRKEEASVSGCAEVDSGFEFRPLPNLSGSKVQAERAATFDPAKGEWPTGMAADERGNLYVALVGLGQIRRLAPDGSATVFATLPAPGRQTSASTLGLAFDAAGHLYVTRSSTDAAIHGVWRISPDGKAIDRFAALPPGFPNALTFDKSGALYVSDSAHGQMRIWRIDPAGRATLWKNDGRRDGLEPTSASGAAFGSTGIAFDQSGKNLYVAGTDQGRILRIPLNADGTAGESAIFVESEQLVGADGIAFDTDHGLYVAVNRADRIARISSQGCIDVIAEGKPLQYPASIAFGSGKDQGILFVANLAVMERHGLSMGVPSATLMKYTMQSAPVISVHHP